MTEHTAETTIVARLDNAQKILDKMFERPTENVFAGKQVGTETPGLVAAQQVGGFLSEERYRMVPGKWCVVHESSGLPLPGPKGHVEGFPLDIARAVAKRLGTFSIDWTAPKEQVLAAVKEHTGEVVAAIGEASECRYCSDVDHLPVRPFRKPEVAR